MGVCYNLILAYATRMLEICQSTCRLLLGRSIKKFLVPSVLLSVGKRLRRVCICGEDGRSTDQVVLVTLSTLLEITVDCLLF